MVHVLSSQAIAVGNFTPETEADTLKGAGYLNGKSGWGRSFKDSSKGYMHDGTPVGGTLHTNLGEGVMIAQHLDF